MLKKFIFFILFFLFPIIVNAQEGNPPPKETITIIADTWCPYNCNPKSPHPGFIVDIAKAAFAKHNIDVNYSILPWTQAIEESRKGKYTGIIGAAINDAPDFIFPVAAQGYTENHFYVKKGNQWKYNGINSLKSIILGAIADYSYSDELDDYIKKYKLDPSHMQMMSGDDALGINLSKLARGKIGATVESNYVMNYYLSQHNMKDQVDDAGSLPPSDKNKLYIAFSPKDKKLAQKYADILSVETANMRTNGELKKILDIYGLTDWEK